MAGCRDACLIAALTVGFAATGGGTPARAEDRASRRQGQAREAKLGLWANPYYEVLNAETPKDTLAPRGQFALIEGKVASVREKRADNLREFRPAAAWGHYGYDPETKRAQFRAAGLDVRSLAGRRIRVCGWIEAGGGERAWIEAERPEQIEMAD